jgi:hypothetical protein
MIFHITKSFDEPPFIEVAPTNLYRESPREGAHVNSL